MVSLKLYFAVLAGASTGELALQLGGEFMEVDALLVDALDDSDLSPPLPFFHSYLDALLLLYNGLAYTEVFR